MTNEEKLDSAKQKLLDAKKEIEHLRAVIAAADCPLKLGDIVTAVKDGTDIEVRIEHIFPIASREEYLDPIVGLPNGWAASGPRRNKTGEFGQWSLTIISFEASFVNGKWVLKPPKTLDEILGIK